jgi:hypothetical protein
MVDYERRLFGAVRIGGPALLLKKKSSASVVRIIFTVLSYRTNLDKVLP